MEFNKKLKEFFKSKELSNKDISKMIPYSEMMVGRYLKGSKPNYDLIMEMIKVWPDIDLNYLYKDEAAYNAATVEEAGDEYKEDLYSIVNRLEVDITKLKECIGTNLTQE